MREDFFERLKAAQAASEPDPHLRAVVENFVCTIADLNERVQQLEAEVLPREAEIP